jgi:hypothetical protein
MRDVTAGGGGTSFFDDEALGCEDQASVRATAPRIISVSSLLRIFRANYVSGDLRVSTSNGRRIAVNGQLRTNMHLRIYALLPSEGG